ncbi:ROK family protein [Mangrovivirga cuniculi]|uniref:Glucokinase n=1 Tax=Mangrovivirga cuniculi TaxID=2715131 RepID=A0A4D7K2G5_9BACT|nr:ROK family protein [Mangrovivirga cuniculi]QCK13568.1 glucokinase [Mangrovivirga cuniculi]
MKKFAVGIDIGGTYTKLGLVDQKGNCPVQSKLPTKGHSDIDDYLKKVKTEVDKLVDEIGECELIGIGIGVPNGNYYRGTIEHAANLEWKGVVPLIDKLKPIFPNIPAILTNDANASAFGEGIFGAAKGVSEFITITLGTGLGSGIVINNKLVYGNNGFAGELGHTRAIDNGRECGCGKKGCLETYCSSTGLKRTLLEMLAVKKAHSKFRDLGINDFHGEEITEEALKGDEVAKAAFEKTGYILGRSLADFVAFSEPKAIYLAGGLVSSGDLLFEPTRKSFEEHLMTIYKGKVEILPSGLMDMNAAILGAAALIWNEYQ